MDRRPSTNLGSIDADTPLQPEWLHRSTPQEGVWRSASGNPVPISAGKVPPRYDTSDGPQRWKEEDRPGFQRRDSGRWKTDERWTEVGGGNTRTYVEPFSERPAGDRWGTTIEAPRQALPRGRGTVLVDPEWKPRPREGATDWRSSVQPTESTPRSEWRNERWHGAPGSRNPDTWRAGGPRPGSDTYLAEPKSRGFTPGGGRGRGALASPFFRSFGSGSNASTQWTGSGRKRYPTDVFWRVYRAMLYAGRLKLPAGLQRDDPLLFLADGDFVDVLEQFAGVDMEEAGRAYTEHYAMLAKIYARGPAQDGGAGDKKEEGKAPQDLPVDDYGADAGWVYKDPHGVLQGPFSKQDIMDWYEAGYFPLTLVLRSTGVPDDAPFKSLEELLRVWTGKGMPPGFASEAAPTPVLPDDLLPDLPQEMGDLAISNSSSAVLPESLGVGAPVLQPHDPVVDPSVVKRSASTNMLLPQQQYLGVPQMPGHMMQDHMGPPVIDMSHQQNPQHHQQPLDPMAHFPQMKHHPGQVQDPGQHMQHPCQPMMSGLDPHMAHMQMQGMGQPPYMMPQGHEGVHMHGGQLHPRVPPPAWGGPPPQYQHATPQGHPQGQASLLDIQQQEEHHRMMLAQQQEQQHQQQLAEQQRHLEEQQRLAAEEHQHIMAEQQQQAAVAAVGASHVAPPPPPPPPPAAPVEPPRPPRPETKPAPWVAAPPPAKSLKDIQMEEAECKAKKDADLAAIAASQVMHTPPGGPWAKVARGSTSSGTLLLKDIQQEEEQQHRTRHSKEHEDEGMFWEYDAAGSGNSTTPAKPPPPPPHIAAPVAARRGGWAAAASAPSALSSHPPPPPPRSTGGVLPPARPSPSAAPAPAVVAPMLEGAGDDDGSGTLTGAFKAWCSEQMQALSGNRDVTLCEFLMTVESNSEVADYITTYLGRSSTVAKFSAEFLKRKLAEQAVGSKKSRKSRAKANAAAAAAASSSSSATTSAVSVADGAAADAATSWEKIPKKGKKKAAKLDPALLGFDAGTDYALLEHI